MASIGDHPASGDRCESEANMPPCKNEPERIPLPMLLIFAALANAVRSRKPA
jgi:hypothetical protein